jgi:hypothetical protein
MRKISGPIIRREVIEEMVSIFSDDDELPEPQKVATLVRVNIV